MDQTNALSVRSHSVERKQVATEYQLLSGWSWGLLQGGGIFCWDLKGEIESAREGWVGVGVQEEGKACTNIGTKVRGLNTQRAGHRACFLTHLALGPLPALCPSPRQPVPYDRPRGLLAEQAGGP